MHPMTHLHWYKSSYSGTQGDSCVEVAVAQLAVHVRDSKDTMLPPFSVSPRAWARFIEHAAAD